MALQHKKINDPYMTIDLYYRILGIDFTSNQCMIVYVNGYSLDDARALLDQQSYAFPKAKDEPISYEMAYNLLKQLDEFKDAIDC